MSDIAGFEFCRFDALFVCYHGALLFVVLVGREVTFVEGYWSSRTDKLVIMWWNILPSLGIIWAAFHVPLVIEKPVLWLTNGKATFRRVLTNKEAWYYLRDERLGDGNVYNSKGLESIPDEEE